MARHDHARRRPLSLRCSPRRHFFHGKDYVNVSSFKRAFRDMGIPLSDADAQRLFYKFDVNADNTVDCREFLKAVFGSVRCRLGTHY